jgi:tripartite-type tricarboxylate transporter receptor subunit TctC
VRQPDVQKKFAGLGADPVGGTPAELASFLDDERARWKDVIQRANVRVD